MPSDYGNDAPRRPSWADPDGAARERAAREQFMRAREQAQQQSGRTNRRVTIDGRERVQSGERTQQRERTRQVDRTQAKRQDGHRPDGSRQSAGQDSHRANEARRNAQRTNRDSADRERGSRNSGQGGRGDYQRSERDRRTSRQTPRRDLPYSSVASRSNRRRSRGLQVGTVQPNFGSLGTSQRKPIPRFALIIAAILILLIIIFVVRSCVGGGGDDAGQAPSDGATAAAVAEDSSAAASRPASQSAAADSSADVSASAAAGGDTSPDAAATPSSGAAANSSAASNDGSGRVSFVAVGDNLPDDLIGYWADAQAGEENDGTYDYRGLYKHIKPYVEPADLAYIDQETHLGGNDIGPRGYPSFNVTDEMADAVVDTGFDFVASATNHSYDWGLYGALNNSLGVWETKPVAFTGTAVTEEQYNRIATLERNGITFALLNYTYGVNWPDDMELPEHSINLIDEDRITRDVARAKEQADVVLVAMHWGTELLMEADEQQQHLAQLLANLDVDVVLGSHPHVIGPVAWVANENGSGHKTLVAYSLGNFLSDHEARSPQVELEGMLCCDFVRTSAGDDTGTSQIKIENAKWVPLVNHTNADRTDFAVYALKDYTNVLGKQNVAYKDNDVDDPVKWLRDTTHKVVGTVIPIDDGRTVIGTDPFEVAADAAKSAASIAADATVLKA